jgi:hypothetical protein
MSAAGPGPKRSAALITLAALAAVAGYNRLPSGGKLTHMDFLADDATVLELCNPLNPAVLPVATGSLPVTLSFSSATGPAREGRRTVAFDLTTISGRPVAAEDLERVGGRRIHLSLSDARGRAVLLYPRDAGQDAEPDPLRPGRWRFPFTAPGRGPFLVTAEFTPLSTGKPLQASANLYLGTTGSAD